MIPFLAFAAGLLCGLPCGGYVVFLIARWRIGLFLKRGGYPKTGP